MSLPRWSSSLEGRDPYAKPETYYDKEDRVNSLVLGRIWKNPAKIDVVSKRRGSHGKQYTQAPPPTDANV